MSMIYDWACDDQLTNGEFRMLVIIDAHGECTLHDLCVDLGMSRSNATVVFTGLRQKDYLNVIRKEGQGVTNYISVRE